MLLAPGILTDWRCKWRRSESRLLPKQLLKMPLIKQVFLACFKQKYEKISCRFMSLRKCSLDTMVGKPWSEETEDVSGARGELYWDIWKKEDETKIRYTVTDLKIHWLLTGMIYVNRRQKDNPNPIDSTGHRRDLPMGKWRRKKTVALCRWPYFVKLTRRQSYKILSCRTARLLEDKHVKNSFDQ